MRAVEISKPGGPEVLRVVDRPVPEPQAGDVLIEVKAAGVSRADVLQRLGNYPPPPGASDIPGLEVAGIVVRGASGYRERDRVCALLTGGGYAEYAAVPVQQALPIPEGWSFPEAATLPENMFTVYDNLFTRAGFHKGQSVLVHGGTSGIGTTAIMLARAFGAAFIAATAGTAEKCAACRELGADLAINYKEEDFAAAVLSATGNRGVDVVFDIVGGDYINRDLDALAKDARVVSIASQRGSQATIDLGKLHAKRATIAGSSLRSRTVAEKAAIADRLRERVWPLLPAKDPIEPLVDSIFTFADAPAAHRRLEASAHTGKIVLVP